jgi:hypothetical protein
MNCGCKVKEVKDCAGNIVVGATVNMAQCPTHAAAFEMKAALEILINGIGPCETSSDDFYPLAPYVAQAKFALASAQETQDG